MRLRTLPVAAAIVVVSVAGVRAEILVGAQVGAGPLRFDDLEDFWDEFDLHHDTDPLAFNWELDGTWRFAERHGVRLSVERITTSVSVSAISMPQTGVFEAELNFTAVPISLSYEFSLTSSAGGAVTLVGVGGDLYLSELEGNEASYVGDPAFDGIRHSSREGEGYGLHGYAKQTAPITDSLSLTGMIRGRWADGMAFEEDDGSVAVNFSSLDVSIGVEWEL